MALAQIPQGSPFNNSSTENVDFADVDLDGDLDAAFADGGDSGNDQSRIWINQGFAQGGTLGVFLDATSTRFPVMLRTSRDVDFVDVDNDGDHDVHLSNDSTFSTQSSSWWINQGGLQAGSPGFFADATAARWVNVGVNGPTTHSSVAAASPSAPAASSTSPATACSATSTTTATSTSCTRATAASSAARRLHAFP